MKILFLIEKVLKNNWFSLEFDRWYFGWQDDPNSKLLQIAKSAFEKVNKTTPKVTAIHAWLECGNLVSGLKNANAISIWPNVKFVHSTEEKVEVASIEKMEKILKNILGEL